MITNLPVIGIDPGSTKSAYVYIATDGRVIDHGKIENHDMAMRLRTASPFKTSIRCAIEAIRSYGSARPMSNDLIVTCQWVGRFMEAWSSVEGSDRPLVTLPRKTVVQHICADATAGDPEVRGALIKRCGKVALAGDEWSALAVALCAQDRARCGIEEAA